MTASRGGGAAQPKTESLAVRTLRILEYIATGPTSAAEVARQMGVNRSSALRLLRDLEDAGYLIRDQTKNYALAPQRFARLAATGDAAQHWISSVTPAMVAVRDETLESTVVGVPSNDVMIYVAFFESLHTVAARERLGTTRPMHCSALGKAYLANLSESELASRLRELAFTGGTSRAVRSARGLGDVLTEARERGFAVDRDETVEGLSCVAVPVFVGATLFGACGVSMPSSRASDDNLQQYSKVLKAQLTKFGLDTTAKSAALPLDLASS